MFLGISGTFRFPTPSDRYILLSDEIVAFAIADAYALRTTRALDLAHVRWGL